MKYDQFHDTFLSDLQHEKILFLYFIPRWHIGSTNNYLAKVMKWRKSILIIKITFHCSFSDLGTNASIILANNCLALLLLRYHYFLSQCNYFKL